MKLKEFNVNEWEKYCLIYDKNHNGLGFKVDITMINGQLSVSFKNLDEKYKKTIKDLVIFIAQGAVQYMYELFDAFYVFDKNEYEKIRNNNYTFMKENTLMYFDVLFNKGFNPFMELVQQQTAVLRARYELSVLTYSNGKWVLPNGQTWTGSGWEKDGTVNYSVLLDPMWETLLGTPCSKEKIA